jgi:hypothetical protein
MLAQPLIEVTDQALGPWIVQLLYVAIASTINESAQPECTSVRLFDVACVQINPGLESGHPCSSFVILMR